MDKNIADASLGFYELIKLAKKVGYIFGLTIEKRVYYMLDGGFVLKVVHMGGSSND